MNINVNKADLIAKLKENRADHVAAYQQAIDKYREKALEWFEQCIATVKAGGEIERMLRLPVPEEHTDDFDRAIDMAEWHNGSTMELDSQQFEQFVRNRWGWHQTFMSNTTSYIGGNP